MFNVLTGFKFIGEKNSRIWNTTQPHLHAWFWRKPVTSSNHSYVTKTLSKPFLSLLKSQLLPLTWYDFWQMVSKKSTNNTVTSQKKPSLLPFQVDGAAEIKKKSWINSVAMFLNNSTQTLLRQKTSWNKQLLLLTALKNWQPPSNVLKYILADDSWFAVRPSGTEPKNQILHRYSWWIWSRYKEKIANIEAEINAFGRNTRLGQKPLIVFGLSSKTRWLMGYLFFIVIKSINSIFLSLF